MQTHIEIIENTQDLLSHVSDSRHTEMGVNELLQNIINAIEPTPSLVDILIYDVGDELRKYQKNGCVDTSRIPQKLWLVAILQKIIITARANGFDIARQNDSIYLFNTIFWQSIPKDYLFDFIERSANASGYESPAEAKTTAFKENGLKQILASTNYYEAKNDKEHVLINLHNGTLQIDTNGHKIREHRAEDFLTYSLPFQYSTTAKAPIFEKYLLEVLPDQKSQNILQEFCGYIFIRHLKLEKALVLYGSGANGKSVFFEVLTALLGENNISTFSLGDLTEQDSGNANRAMLKDKLVNYGSEIRGDKIDTDIFKRLVSGEPVSARLRYANPFELRSGTKFIFNANTLPRDVEHSEAFFRRFLIIPFEQTICEQNRDSELHLKIINQELEGVFQWVLEGLNRLLAQKRFSECTKAQNSLDMYRLESDSVAMFTSEAGYTIGNCELEKTGTTVAKLYADYREYCKDAGNSALAKNNFSKRLEKLGFMAYRTKLERGFYCKKLE